MLYEVVGDLVKDETTDILCHQTNCMGKMASGIAGQIAHFYPIAAVENEKYCLKYHKDRCLLGTNLYIKTDSRTIVNMYGQHRFGRDKQYTEYDALQSCIDKLKAKLLISRHKLKVGFPVGIGCGLAGGDWSIVRPMIVKLAEEVPQDVYLYTRYCANVLYPTARRRDKQKWQTITISASLKSYIVRYDNVEKYYSSMSSILNDWEFLDNLRL